jgi:glycosyltransferase involved in cell wall biosynthesis
MSEPLFTIVVITYEREERLAPCLRSVFAQDHRPLEIVVVDDGSRDGTAEAARRLGEECPGDVVFTLRVHETNRGIGPARNTGIDAARGEVVGFLDDDCVARPDWARELMRGFATGADVVAAGGAVDEPPSPTWVQRAAEGINFLGTRERDVPAVNGCNMAFRRSFLAEHPFDPGVRYGADELDLCFAAAAGGGRVRFLPAARVTHHHRRTLGAFLRQQFLRGRGSVWVRKRHRRGIWPRKNWIVLLLLLSLVALVLIPRKGTLLAAAGFAGLFLAQTVALDLSRGKSPGAALRTLPLVALGYLFEFAGAVVGLFARTGDPADPEHP